MHRDAPQNFTRVYTPFYDDFNLPILTDEEEYCWADELNNQFNVVKYRCVGDCPVHDGIDSLR